MRNSETAAGLIFFAGVDANPESLRFVPKYAVLIVIEVTHLNVFIMLCEDASHFSPVNKKKIMCKDQFCTRFVSIGFVSIGFV